MFNAENFAGTRCKGIVRSGAEPDGSGMVGVQASSNQSKALAAARGGARANQPRCVRLLGNHGRDARWRRRSFKVPPHLGALLDVDLEHYCSPSGSDTVRGGLRRAPWRAHGLRATSKLSRAEMRRRHADLNGDAPLPLVRLNFSTPLRAIIKFLPRKIPDALRRYYLSPSQKRVKVGDLRDRRHLLQEARCPRNPQRSRRLGAGVLIHQSSDSSRFQPASYHIRVASHLVALVSTT